MSSCLPTKEALQAIVLTDLSFQSPPAYIMKAYALAMLVGCDLKVNHLHIEILGGLKATPLVLNDLIYGARACLFHPAECDKIFIVFPGTKSLDNIITDLEIQLVEFDPKFSDCRVHDGFRQSFFALRNLIELEIAKTPSAELVIAGHSLGSGGCHVVCKGGEKGILLWSGHSSVQGRV